MLKEVCSVNTQMSPSLTHGLKRAPLYSRNPTTAIIIKITNNQSI